MLLRGVMRRAVRGLTFGALLLISAGRAEASLIDVLLVGYDLDYRDVVNGTYEHVSDDIPIPVKLRFDDTVLGSQSGHASGPGYEEDFILTFFGASQITSEVDFPNLLDNPFPGNEQPGFETRLEEYDRIGDFSFQAQAAYFSDHETASDGATVFHARSSIVGWDFDGGDGVMNVKTAEDVFAHLTTLMVGGRPLSFITETYVRDHAFRYADYPIYLVSDMRIASISRPIPEPSSTLLFSSGLVGLAGWRRKRLRRC